MSVSCITPVEEKRTRWVRMLVPCAAWMLAFGSAYAQEPAPSQLNIQPATVTRGVPTTVTVTARFVPSPALIQASVTLARYDDLDRVVSQLGQMYDDGSHGDVTPGDFVFTTQLTINEPVASMLLLRSSAGYLRTVKRVRSDSRPLFVADTATAADSRRDLATAIQAGNFTAAYQKLGSRLNRNGVLTRLSAADRQQLIAALNSCTVIETSESYEVCEGQVQEAGQSRTLQFMFVRDALGAWRVLGW
jgi:hypothetical protein